MVSSIGAEEPPDGDDVFSVYLRAKAQADAALAESDRAWTIVRPGSLDDEPGTGRVRLTTGPVRDAVSRDDVAATLAAILHEPRSVRHVFYVIGGDEPDRAGARRGAGRLTGTAPVRSWLRARAGATVGPWRR